MSTKYEISHTQGFAIIILCSFLIILNLFLLIQNQKLKQFAQNSRESSVTVGKKILPLGGFDNSGNKVELKPNKQKILILVFSSTCRFCDRNADNWKKILQLSNSGEIKMFGVSLGKDGEKFLNKHGFENQIPMLNLSFDSLSEKPIFDVTPQTILVDSEGKAEKVWSGILDEKSLDEILNTTLTVKSVD